MCCIHEIKISSQAVKQKNVEPEKVREDFEPFVLEGLVSLDKFDPKPVKIMRDTCCAVNDFGKVIAL